MPDDGLRHGRGQCVARHPGCPDADGEWCRCTRNAGHDPDLGHACACGHLWTVEAS